MEAGAELDKPQKIQKSTEDLKSLQERFDREEELVRLVNARRGAVLAIIFVMGGLVMDWFVYPDLLVRFLILRAACCSLLGGVLALLYWPTTQQYSRALIHLIALLPMVTLDWMLVQIATEMEQETEYLGVGRYYAGLNLNMVGAVLLLRWRFTDGVANALLCMGGYLAVALAMEFPLDNMLTATFFLFVTGAFACVGVFFYNRLRFAEFCLREEVVAQQEELAANNRELSIALQERDVALKKIKEAQAELIATAKLSSLGTMAAGIVHEINNPMNYVKTALHALRMYDEDMPEEEREDYIDTINDAEEGANRVIAIVSDMRSFTKGETGLKEEVVVVDTVEMSRRLLSGEIKNIELQVDIPGDLKVQGNANQLSQVFINIVHNAAQALEGVNRDNPLVRISSEPQTEETVQIFIRDNGPGIAPEDIESIFDPFFTKKEVGEGMGMGLTNCHRIIESHDGKIEAVSELGEFTEFRITLPLAWKRKEEDEDEDEDEDGDDDDTELEAA